MEVGGFLERRSLGPVVSHAGIQSAVVYGQGQHGVRTIRAAAVDPLRAVEVTTDVASLRGSCLVCAGVEIPLIHRQGANPDAVSRAAAVSPRAPFTAVIDAEVEMMVHDAEVEAPSPLVIVLTGDIPNRATERLRGVHPGTDGEVPIAQAQGWGIGPYLPC